MLSFDQNKIFGEHNIFFCCAPQIEIGCFHLYHGNMLSPLDTLTFLFLLNGSFELPAGSSRQNQFSSIFCFVSDYFVISLLFPWYPLLLLLGMSTAKKTAHNNHRGLIYSCHYTLLP